MTHPKLDLIIGLLAAKIPPDTVREMAWPGNIEELCSMQRYYILHIAPMGQFKKQPHAMFATIVKRASRLTGIAAGDGGLLVE